MHLVFESSRCSLIQQQFDPVYIPSLTGQHERRVGPVLRVNLACDKLL